MSVENRGVITAELQVETTPPGARQTQVLRLVGVALSSWHRRPRGGERKRPGPARRPMADEVITAVVTMATENPWYGYKRIAIMCRRTGQAVKDRMSRELGHAIDIHGHVLWTFPGPDRLAHLEKFPGLFGRKVEYLNALGRAALAGELDTEALRAMPREEALKSLQRLPGIGVWGSELVRLRALSAVDELPSQERRLLGAVRTEYGLASEPDQDTLERLAEKWSPYRMWVCVCLRRTLEGGAGMTHSRASQEAP